MNSATLRLVLLVSSAHALVHVYELSLPSLELEIAKDYAERRRASSAPQLSPAMKERMLEDLAQGGKREMGLLSTTWRMPFGFGALLAGWLVDRWGPRRMLLVYLVGGAAACWAAGVEQRMATLFVTMFLMGAFASIYHPAGLTLISTETKPEERARALGLHGIFGSAGIASAPFLAALALGAGASWRQFYLLLAAAGALLGLLLWHQWGRGRDLPKAPVDKAEDEADWPAFAVLIAATLLQGFVYAGVLSFLTRYLAASTWAGGQLPSASLATALVLAMGCIGQYAAGRFARIGRLERQLLQVTLANIPMLLWMSFAEGNQRILAAAAFSIVHFMHQPLYNSLVAIYTPVTKRSLCYGFSFAMSFGLGGLGATLVGFTPSERLAYQLLAGVAAVSSVLCFTLWQLRRPGRPAR